MKTITDRSLKNLATRAANSYPVGSENSANAYILDGVVHVSTSAANGDNVPWATDLLYRVTVKLNKAYPQLLTNFSSMQHCQGNCSVKMRISQPVP